MGQQGYGEVGMTRSAAVAERIVTGGGVLATVAWCSCALFVIFHYRGGTTTSTWSARVVMMLIAGAVTTAVVLAVRAGWRQALERPLPAGRLNGWIIRRPGWQLALFYWIALFLPSLVAGLSGHRARHWPSGGLLGAQLAVSVLGASFTALMMRVAWGRQAHNGNAMVRERPQDTG